MIYSRYLRSWSVLNKLLRTIYTFTIGLHSGIWLGIFNRDDLYNLDEIYYQSEDMYRNRDYNVGGLFSWEKHVVDKYFYGKKTILVGAAGGGREIIGLSDMEFQVDGFECNQTLITNAKKLLAELDIKCTLELSERNMCPTMNSKQYDAILVGWGGYMLIHTAEARIKFLRSLRARISKGAPILISFYHRESESFDFKLTVKTANLIKRLRGKQHPSITLGDSLTPNFVHHFSHSEIKNELEAGGYHLVYYSTVSYGHAVGIAR
ncbi:MAG: hypothetical protein AB2787_08215 [Candidatus Thiodiazotropha endolucinida]